MKTGVIIIEIAIMTTAREQHLLNVYQGTSGSTMRTLKSLESHYMGMEMGEEEQRMCENVLCAAAVRPVSEGRRKILLIKVFALSCVCPSAPDAPQSLSPPNEGPLCEAHESAAVIVVVDVFTPTVTQPCTCICMLHTTYIRYCNLQAQLCLWLLTD